MWDDVRGPGRVWQFRGWGCTHARTHTSTHTHAHRSAQRGRTGCTSSRAPGASVSAVAVAHGLRAPPSRDLARCVRTLAGACDAGRGGHNRHRIRHAENASSEYTEQSSPGYGCSRGFIWPGQNCASGRASWIWLVHVCLFRDLGATAAAVVWLATWENADTWKCEVRPCALCVVIQSGKGG